VLPSAEPVISEACCPSLRGKVSVETSPPGEMLSTALLSPSKPIQMWSRGRAEGGVGVGVGAGVSVGIGGVITPTDDAQANNHAAIAKQVIPFRRARKLHMSHYL
jgi:hypothetical protein